MKKSYTIAAVIALVAVLAAFGFFILEIARLKKENDEMLNGKEAEPEPEPEPNKEKDLNNEPGAAAAE